MDKKNIIIGEEYAIRESHHHNEPLQHVKILKHIRGMKWQAEWIEPNKGLVDYVESKHILVPWKEHKAYSEDEQLSIQLNENRTKHGYNEKSSLANALHEIFDCLRDQELSYCRGILSGPPNAIERLKQRIKFENHEDSFLAFIDRNGIMHIPYSESLEIAKAFCAAEPTTILTYIDATEREWTQEALKPGNSYKFKLLNEYKASWALIRQWAGHDEAIAQREARIRELERLVLDAIYELQKSGNDQEANRLRRAL